MTKFEAIVIAAFGPIFWGRWVGGARWRSVLIVSAVLVVLVLVVACGGQTIADPPAEQSPTDAFVEAACLHIGCPGWPSERAACEANWTMAVERAGEQDATCLEAATSVLRKSACGAETDDAADGVLNGKCSK